MKSLPIDYLTLLPVLIGALFNCHLFTGHVSAVDISESIRAIGLLGSHFGLPQNATYDYVVIGGGTAGLTIATRLAENASNTVAVIEAGGFYEFDNGNLTSVPGYSFLNLAPNPLVDWEIMTQPQAGLGGRPFAYVQGKQLGGSSAKNLQAFHRGTKGAYQEWANMVGDQSYTFENLLPYFEKSVHFTPPNNKLRPANATVGYNLSSFSAAGGPLHVSYPNTPNSFSSYFASAFPGIGVSEASDFTSGSLSGYQYVGFSLDPSSQTRSSSETSFLRSALVRTTNMIVYKSALARRILFNEDKRATGVLVDTAGFQYVLSAKKEVILSAGAFRSPQLLMVSGVGNKVTLESLGIPLLSDRPGVGQNMWDHAFFGPTYETNLITNSQLADPAFAAAQSEEYNEKQTGVLTNIGNVMLAWEKVSASLRSTLSNATVQGLASFPPDWPDIEYIPLSVFAGGPFLGNFITSFSAVVAPLSRGNVTINSTDTAKNPIVSPNILLDPRDRELAVLAFKRSRQLMSSPALRPILVGPEIAPGVNVTTDAQIMDFITATAATLNHASCTNAMGTADDPMAVIDSQARVFGVTGLRVVDVSSFPLLPPGHPQATVYALAEKIADLIMTGGTGGNSAKSTGCKAPPELR